FLPGSRQFHTLQVTVEQVLRSTSEHWPLITAPRCDEAGVSRHVLNSARTQRYRHGRGGTCEMLPRGGTQVQGAARHRAADKNAWELKYRRKEDASCGAATAYREEQGDVRILETLRALLPEAGLEKGAPQVRDLVANETLRELAVIKTVRRTFKMPTNAVVDIDETDWGLSVGEIEIVLHEADAEALAGAVQNATAEIAQLAAQL
ncbi:hypothetical protein V5799_030681, partial [Amblyomma americanum]